MVVISGQVPSHAIGQDAFQECDTVGITRPVVKHNFLVKDVKDLAETVKKAFYIARTGRPGPCWSIFRRISRCIKRRIPTRKR
jgi:acetolactate synthase-1/2/3 large subunit